MTSRLWCVKVDSYNDPSRNVAEIANFDFKALFRCYTWFMGRQRIMMSVDILGTAKVNRKMSQSIHLRAGDWVMSQNPRIGRQENMATKTTAVAHANTKAPRNLLRRSKVLPEKI